MTSKYDKNNWVLRTVYLPMDLDQQLKAAAFRAGCTVGDLIYEIIRDQLADVPTFAEELAAAKKKQRRKKGEAVLVKIDREPAEPEPTPVEIEWQVQQMDTDGNGGEVGWYGMMTFDNVTEALAYEEGVRHGASSQSSYLGTSERDTIRTRVVKVVYEEIPPRR